MKKNLIPIAGIAFVVAIIATGIFYWLVVGKLKSSVSSSGKSIVVAARNLERGAVLQPADVKLVPWGGPDVPQGAFAEVSAVSGLTLVSALQENEPVVQSRVASRNSGIGAGLGITPGMRAISVHGTDSSGIVGMLRPGYKVDLQPVSNQAELRTILLTFEVLAAVSAGDRTQPRPH